MNANSERSRRLNRARVFLRESLIYRNLWRAAWLRGEFSHAAQCRRVMRKFALDYRLCADLV
jgi:hypothetical protein